MLSIYAMIMVIKSEPPKAKGAAALCIWPNRQGDRKMKTTDIFAYYKKIALFCHAKP